jgi:acyl-coenzyme A synthetase/AMP-(fatty) acid ligase
VDGAQSLFDFPVADLAGLTVPGLDQPAFISHTSGTTGLPKLAVQTPDVLWERVRLQKAFADKLWRDESVALCVSMVHARFYTALYLGLSYGNPMLVAADDTPQNIGPLFAEHRPGVVETQPNSFVDWEVLAGAEGAPLANVRYYNATFDAVHPRTVQVLLDASARPDPKFFQLYGQTETGPVAGRWFTVKDAATMDARCVGRGLPGVTRLRVVDDSGAVLAPGLAGHIEVSSRTRAVTYLGEAERYGELVHDGWWRMGDVGYLDTLDRLHLLDRAVDQVGSVASNLELEDALMQRLPELREIVVVAGPDGRAVPVVCSRDDSPLDARRWAEAVEDLGPLGEAIQLPYDLLPRTATRKIQRPELTRLLADGVQSIRIPMSAQFAAAAAGAGRE